MYLGYFRKAKKLIFLENLRERVLFFLGTDAAGHDELR